MSSRGAFFHHGLFKPFFTIASFIAVYYDNNILYNK